MVAEIDKHELRHINPYNKDISEQHGFNTVLLTVYSHKFTEPYCVFSC